MAPRRETTVPKTCLDAAWRRETAPEGKRTHIPGPEHYASLSTRVTKHLTCNTATKPSTLRFPKPVQSTSHQTFPNLITPPHHFHKRSLSKRCLPPELLYQSPASPCEQYCQPAHNKLPVSLYTTNFLVSAAESSCYSSRDVTGL